MLLILVHSGELGTLRFCEAEEHAHSHAHARSEGRDPGDPLRELQSSLHPEHDPHGGEGAQPQVRLCCSPGPPGLHFTHFILNLSSAAS